MVLFSFDNLCMAYGYIFAVQLWDSLLSSAPNTGHGPTGFNAVLHTEGFAPGSFTVKNSVQIACINTWIHQIAPGTPEALVTFSFGAVFHLILIVKSEFPRKLAHLKSGINNSVQALFRKWALNFCIFILCKFT